MALVLMSLSLSPSAMVQRLYPLNPWHPSNQAVVAWRPKHRFFSSKHHPEHSEAKLWHKSDVFIEK